MKFIPFWIFLTCFKFGGGLHYTMLSPLGEQIFPVWAVGFMIGGAAFVQLCLDIPSGYLTDRFGYKKMLGITTLCFIIASAGLLFGLTMVTFLASLAISILGWQFFTSGSNAYVMSQSHTQWVGKMMSTKDIATSIGIVLSSAVVAFAVDWQVRTLGLVLMIIFAVAYSALLLAPRETHVHEQSPAHRRKKLHPKFWGSAWQAARKLKPASYLLMITSFTAATFYAIIWFVVPLLIASQVYDKTLSIGLGIFDFAIVVMGFFLGRVVDSYNKKILVLIGIIIFAVSGIALGSNFGFVFLLLGFIATTGDELTGLSLWSWLYSIDTDHEHYGLITGMIEVWSDLGWTVGPIIAGILYTVVGPSWAIAIGGMVILINLAVYIVMVKHPLPNLFKKIPDHHVKQVRHKH